MDISELIKVDGWYRGPDKEWEKEIYGFYPNGLGDLIYNSLRKIIEDNDKSKWAYQLFDNCVVLLRQGKRWPDEYTPDKLKGKTRYRSQRSMTRDPWVMFYAACIHLDRRSYILLKPQCRLYRPNLWELRKALLGKKNSYLFWRRIDVLTIKKDFVKILFKYREWSYERRV